MRLNRITLCAVALVVGAACSKDETATVQPDARVSGSALDRAKSDRDDDGRKIAIRDNCDPNDPAWAPTGGCLLRKGDVTAAEFNAYLRSPLTNPANGALIGHPAWRNDPSYASIESGTTLRIVNAGGRTHTFTEVVQFGGGRVPPLNIGLTAAPECANAVNVPAGGTADVAHLTDGVHNFQCCIHPWMRATVRVHPETD